MSIGRIPRLVVVVVWLIGAGALAAGAGALAAGAAPAAPAAPAVSLEFDHALSDEQPGLALAAAHGWQVTFFAMSGRIGLPGYFTVAQLLAYQAQGDEIGGHTIDHMDLSQLPPAAQQHEICGDRSALEADGFDVTDFAYPYGHFDVATPAIARSCGYQSARGAGGLESQGGCYGTCPPVESIPPADPFDTRTVNSIMDSTSVTTMERYVTRAERTGGWLQIVFHHVCDGCDPYSISLPSLDSFLSWLATQPVQVQTVRAVIDAPFAAPTVRVRAERRRSVTLRAAVRCPSTPIKARCSRVPGLRWPDLPAASGDAVTVLAAPTAQTFGSSWSSTA